MALEFNSSIFNISNITERTARIDCNICQEDVNQYNTALQNIPTTMNIFLYIALFSFVMLFWINPLLFKDEKQRQLADSIALQTSFASLIVFAMLMIRFGGHL